MPPWDCARCWAFSWLATVSVGLALWDTQRLQYASRHFPFRWYPAGTKRVPGGQREAMFSIGFSALTSGRSTTIKAFAGSANAAQHIAIGSNNERCMVSPPSLPLMQVCPSGRMLPVGGRETSEPAVGSSGPPSVAKAARAIIGWCQGGACAFAASLTLALKLATVGHEFGPIARQRLRRGSLGGKHVLVLCLGQQSNVSGLACLCRLFRCLPVIWADRTLSAATDLEPAHAGTVVELNDQVVRVRPIEGDDQLGHLGITSWWANRENRSSTGTFRCASSVPPIASRRAQMDTIKHVMFYLLLP